MSRRGFSLIELVIVVVILGIIAAIAVPRMSRASRTSQESALRRDLQILRHAIEHFAAEHQGLYPDSRIVDQLTKHSAFDGTPEGGAVAASELIYGPYLRSIPPLPLGANAGYMGVQIENASTTETDFGWIYNIPQRHIRPNTRTTEKDDRGVTYLDY